MNAQPSTQGPAAGRGITDLLALGFASCIGMWAAGYFTHLPGSIAPKWLTLLLMLVALFAGGFMTGKLSARGWKGGALVGFIAWLINLLVLGSLIAGNHPGQVVPDAGLWILGSLATCCITALLGAAVGTTRRDSRKPAANWPGVLAGVAAAATFLLLMAGGLVTSADAGMAVPDWPNSFGFNMFLFPLSRMTDSIFFEHAHRLFGALVGLTVLTMAIVFQTSKSRRTITTMGWIALVLVIVQGVLGGERVTMNKTTLAMVHGVLGQVFFAYLVALATMASRAFEELCQNRSAPPQSSDRTMGKFLVGLLVIQLLLGAYVRHYHEGVHAHLTVGIIALCLVVAAGVSAWGKYPSITLIRRTGLGLMHATGLQVLLGFAALGVGVLSAEPGKATTAQLIVATIHQAIGALVFAWAVRLTVLHHRPDTSVQ